jgi:conserved domain protein
MASGQWNKEEALRDLKAQAAELDRKIALTLAPMEEAEGAGEEMKLKENVQQ